MSVTRKLRHWKQRYDPNAAFVFRRRVVWNGATHEPGDPIPEELAANRTKLRRFWESGWIELAEFEAPDVATGQVSLELPDGITMTQRGPWFTITLADGSVHKAQGAEARDELLAQLRQ